MLGYNCKMHNFIKFIIFKGFMNYLCSLLEKGGGEWSSNTNFRETSQLKERIADMELELDIITQILFIT